MDSEKKQSSHCIKVPKIFDWVSKPTLIKLREKIKLDEKKASDYLCCDFHIPCGVEERTTLWTSFGINKIGGSICIDFKSGCGGPLDVFINGKKEASVEEGSSFAATFSPLHSVEVVCSEPGDRTDCCIGEFKIILHYSPTNDCEQIKHTNCFLSDRLGQPVSLNRRSSVTCKVLTPPEKRTNIQSIGPKGNITTLQRIDLLKQGFVTVQFLNKKGELCFQCVFSFSEVETVFLCAPPGTAIKCDIVEADCKAYVIPPIDKCSPCIEIVIIIELCQNILSVADVKVEVIGNICNSRESSATNALCPAPIPPEQCAIFP
ncbi:DUF3992 domain-containing protein [Bacillus tianshenii]|nr:DUF3992 domain-containing protein [Bacillus tianshenii]